MTFVCPMMTCLADLCFALQEAMVPKSSVLRRWEKRTGFPEVTHGEFKTATVERPADYLSVDETTKYYNVV